jgi:hypothetical protein
MTGAQTPMRGNETPTHAPQTPGHDVWRASNIETPAHEPGDFGK